MKVLHINTNYLISELHQTLIENLEKINIHNNVFVPTNDSEYSLIMPNENVVVRECFHKWDRIFFDYKQRKIANALQKSFSLQDFSLIHAHTLFTDGNCARAMGQKSHIPYIVAVRNTDVNTFFAKAFWLRSRGIQVMRDAEAVIFLSPAYKKQVLENYVPIKYVETIEKKCFILPNGIDDFWLENVFKNKTIDKTLQRIQKHEIRIIYVGAIEENKNTSLTMQAINLLENIGYTIVFTIIGDINDKSLYEKLKNHTSVRYVPYQPREIIMKFLRESDVFVMPSHTETFGLVYAEAMTQGLPIVYTRGQGFDGQFEEGTVGFATSDTDAHELSQKIMDVLDNYERLSKNCLMMCTKFDWSQIVQQYAQIYENCITCS